jgi:hypothetical protein
MSATRLTPTERIARGLKYTAIGPVDVTRGTVGAGTDAARTAAAWVADRYRRAQIKSQLDKNLASAHEAFAGLPQTFRDARKPRRRRPRPVLLVGAGIGVLALGAVTFSIVRRSTQPDPSPLPPSVDVAPKP